MLVESGSIRKAAVAGIVAAVTTGIMADGGPPNNTIERTNFTRQEQFGPFAPLDRLNMDPLPPDIIPREILESKLGISILDLPGARLHLRRGIMDEQEIWLLSRSPNMSLYIVLLDSTHVDMDVLTPKQRTQLPQQLIDATEKQLLESDKQAEEEYKSVVEERFISYYSLLGMHKGHLGEGIITQDQYKKFIVLLNNLYKPYLQGPNEEDLRAILGGKFTRVQMENGMVLQAIFLPVRDGWLYPIQEEYRSIVEEVYGVPGKTDYLSQFESIFNTSSGIVLSPSPSQSYPDRRSYKRRRRDSGGFVVDNRTPAFRLRHELEHILTQNETSADIRALEGIESAGIKKRNGDDSGFFIIFETEKGNTISDNLGGHSISVSARSYRIKPKNTQELRAKANRKVWQRSQRKIS